MKTKKIITGLAVCLLILLGANYANAAWNPAPANPPANNASEPINVSASDQTFSGTKILNMGAAMDGLLRVQGGLTVGGIFQLTNGAGAGKVLTSDATGLASWQTPAAGVGPFLGDSVAFSQNTSGAYSSTLQPGNYILEMKGAGAGGGGASWGGSNPESGGGGGEGETVYYRFTVSSPTGFSGSVGVGGMGGMGDNSAGAMGGNTAFNMGATSYLAGGGLGGCYLESSTFGGGANCGQGGGYLSGVYGKSVSANVIRIGGMPGGIPMRNTDDEDTNPGGNGGGQFGGRGGTRYGGGGLCPSTSNATNGFSGSGGGGAAHDGCRAGTGGAGYIYIWKQ